MISFLLSYLLSDNGLRLWLLICFDDLWTLEHLLAFYFLFKFIRVYKLFRSGFFNTLALSWDSSLSGWTAWTNLVQGLLLVVGLHLCVVKTCVFFVNSSAPFCKHDTVLVDFHQSLNVEGWANHKLFKLLDGLVWNVHKLNIVQFFLEWLIVL